MRAALLPGSRPTVDRTYPLSDAGGALAAAANRELLTAVLLPN